MSRDADDKKIQCLKISDRDHLKIHDADRASGRETLTDRVGDLFCVPKLRIVQDEGVHRGEKDRLDGYRATSVMHRNYSTFEEFQPVGLRQEC